MLLKHRPDLDGFPTTLGPQTTGDGVRLARDAGARLVDMDRVQLHPTGFVDPGNPEEHTKTLAAELLRGVGGLLLDRRGRRFTNELDTRRVQTCSTPWLGCRRQRLVFGLSGLFGLPTLTGLAGLPSQPKQPVHHLASSYCPGVIWWLGATATASALAHTVEVCIHVGSSNFGSGPDRPCDPSALLRRRGFGWLLGQPYSVVCVFLEPSLGDLRVAHLR